MVFVRIKQYLHKDILIDLWLSRCQIQLEKMFGSINCSKNGMFQSNVSAAMVNVQRLWSFSSFNCCMMNSVMTAWLLLANETWSGEHTDNAGRRKEGVEQDSTINNQGSFLFLFLSEKFVLWCCVALACSCTHHTIHLMFAMEDWELMQFDALPTHAG